ncbi:very-long-chain aldehyde decarbonylase CER1-like isoform X2 [Benincasa hispida]|uniref:very-long-chain aldehyde decarbonylase CER1-like isoform X2 n=1 Tax=Benincasa hispida TaxID=102211 RepID=UPI0019026835|nr:very-long-chain aldehyde decarbonylase CER1-like isoform X2 [Benincasa hispida]
MASIPGILTDWPWKPLGSFKYLVLAPGVIHSIYHYMTKDETERDISYLLIFPFLLWRMIHSQMWISFSRYQTAKGTARIVHKGVEFEQVDREQNWDDQILLNGVLFYIISNCIEKASNLRMWRTDGVVTVFLLHVGPVEFLYYWFHRALHHHYLYSRYHSHHHSSIVTEPITAVIHPFAELLAYFILFAIPLMVTVLNGSVSVGAYFLYITYIDFMNYMGHCNFEFIPNRLFILFPPLKFLIYTPSFHSLHHTQFRTNYSLFMPFYDYIYDTIHKSTDDLYLQSLKRGEEVADVVHLTHLTTPDSIYPLRLGFAELASRPHTSTWYLSLLSPVTMLLTWIYGLTFVVERNQFEKLKLQTWAIPKFDVQYLLQWQTKSINSLIEEAITNADQKGCKVLTLGLLNQREELNNYGEVYIQRNLKLKVRVVDGSSLAVAIVVNNIPKFATQVLLTGKITKLAFALYHSLSKKGIQIAVLNQQHYKKLNNKASNNFEEGSLVLAKGHSHNIWLVGEGLTDEEQLKAPKGTTFIPFSQFPPKIVRKDCFYNFTPAMEAPPSLQNMHSCENWLPRRVMSAWRIAGVVHAMEGWTEHECGYTMSDIERVWKATIGHGFQPLHTIAYGSS